MKPLICKAERAVVNSGSATIFVNRDNDPNQYGKVVINHKGKVETIVGNSDDYNFLSIAGLYVYPNDVILKIEQLQPSDRGLFEITDLNKHYFNENKMQILQLPKESLWLDTNTFDSLLSASNIISKTNNTYNNDNT